MILVTGASGNIGSALVRVLRERGAVLKAAARSDTEGDRSSMALDFLDPRTFAPAVDGCDAVFLLRPPAISKMRSTLNVFIDVARRVGVKQIVFVSVAGAERNTLVPHHAVEEHLKAGPSDWTILRPGFFAQNLTGAYRRDIVEDERIYVPAADGRVAFIDARDVADVAATALLGGSRHLGQQYLLTGPEPLSFYDVAGLLGLALKRPIRYQPAGVLGYAAHLAHQRIPAMQILVQTILHVSLRKGGAELVDATLADLLGRPPRSVREFIQDHRALFQAPNRPEPRCLSGC